MIGWIFLVIIVALAVYDEWRRIKLRRKYEAALERERKMRLVAEAAVEVLSEALDTQYTINRRRVSEAARVIHKPTKGGFLN